MKAMMLVILMLGSTGVFAFDCTNPETKQVIRVPEGDSCPWGFY